MLSKVYRARAFALAARFSAQWTAMPLARPSGMGAVAGGGNAKLLKGAPAVRQARMRLLQRAYCAASLSGNLADAGG